MKRYILFSLVFIFSLCSHAQFAYYRSNEIFSTMPEVKELEKEIREMKDIMNTQQTDKQPMGQHILDQIEELKKNNPDDPKIDSLEQEIVKEYEAEVKMYEDLQAKMNQRWEEVIQSVFVKLKAAINEVVSEKKLKLVWNSDEQKQWMYVAPTVKAEDITDYLIEKLGINENN